MAFSLRHLFAPQISKEDMRTVKKLLNEAQDEAKAANTCTNPETFFRHYDALKATLAELKRYEKYPIFKGNTPRKDLQRAEENEQTEINAMIQRAFVSVREKADHAKTAQEKHALFDAFFSQLSAYAPRMNRFNTKVVRDLHGIVDSQLRESESVSS